MLREQPNRVARSRRPGGTACLWVALVVVSVALACDTPIEPKPLENKVRWSTASELDSYGFDVYRSTAEEGPFTVINDEPVPGAGTSDTPTDYEFVDGQIEPETAYYYYIEAISMNGQRERATPVIRAGPKSAAR